MRIPGITTLNKLVTQELAQYLVEDTTEVILNAAVKRRIATACSISTQELAKELRLLTRMRVMYRVDTDIYELNSELFVDEDVYEA